MATWGAGSGVTIGVDIGGTNVRAARVAADGSISGHIRVRTAPGHAVAEQVCDLARSLADRDVIGVGIGVPGRLDATGETILTAGYVELAGVRLGEIVGDAVGRPVVLANDAHMALAGELAVGAAAGARNVALFTVGTGVGGAVAIGGRIHAGEGNAGQLGHLALDPRGPRCNCGRAGCAEVFASGTALGRYREEAGIAASVTVAELLARRDSEPAAAAVLGRWARAWREAIDTVVAVLDPELVVLGGGLGAAAYETVSAYEPASVSSWFPSRVVAARLGDDAGVIGAGLSARR